LQEGVDVTSNKAGGALTLLIACAMGAVPAAADVVLRPVAPSLSPEPPTKKPVWERTHERLPSHWDANDSYYHRGERFPLLRSRTEYAARFSSGIDKEAMQDRLRALLGGDFSGFIEPVGQELTVIKVREDILPAESEVAIGAIRAQPGVEFVFPVFISAKMHNRMLLTDEVIVKLRPSVAIGDITGLEPSYGLAVVKKILGTEDEYLLRIQDPKTVDPLVVASALWESGLVQWAEPNFIQEYERFLLPGGCQPGAPGCGAWQSGT